MHVLHERMCLLLLRSLQKQGCRTTRRISITKRLLSTTPTEPADPANKATSSIDQSEVDKFSRIAAHWWKPGGEFGALHSLNELRVPLIRDGLIGQRDDAPKERIPQPLTDHRVLDVGCGGGILSEPLARLGASVTGLDASPDNITVATHHTSLDSTLSERITYVADTVENHLATRQGEPLYDGVVASEILEHVSNQRDFVATCGRLVKPGGSLFITTLNKTLASYALAIVAAEKVLRLVPDGAHDWEKFVSLKTVTEWLEAEGFRVALVHGMMLNPLTTRWRWVSDTSVNYALHAVKRW